MNSTSRRCTIEDALKLVGDGFKIFPLHTPGKSGKKCDCKEGDDCSRPGKHPRIKDWPTEATYDLVTIRKWWDKWPDANIGILTGESTGLAVVDFDGDAGRESYVKLCVTWQGWRDTLQVATGNGIHCYFHWPKEGGFRTSTAVMPGVDTRGDGGYVIGPGSMHESGKLYAWASGAAGKKRIPPRVLKDDLRFCTQERTQDGIHERTQERTQRELVWAPNESQKAQIAGFIVATVPTTAGTRHKKMFAFIRRMQAIVPDGVGPDQYRDILREWYDAAKAAAVKHGFVIKDPFRQCMFEARDAPKRIRKPFSEQQTFDSVVKQCQSSFANKTPPVDVRRRIKQLGYFDDPEMIALMMLCHGLSSIWPESFPLAALTASQGITKIIGRPSSQATAGRMLKNLQSDRVLKCTKAGKFGQRGIASEYRWIAWPDDPSP